MQERLQKLLAQAGYGSRHETRSDSKLVPDEVRKESRVWLAQAVGLNTSY